MNAYTTTTPTHHHCWTTASHHRTSEGTISYQHCSCGAQRILAPAQEANLLAVVEAG
ncbi:hypothetical protein [Rhodococcus sp. EPR-157]|uniref:hypothetical protein n=1 Tax=Rhodococcus sp. EPR-157 TaxID=1813677 RepID=UPI0018D413F9|nr:hypothetical protein [Rhodococcus sp. EPR-157]